MNTETKSITLIHKHVSDHTATEMESVTGLTLNEIRKRAKSMSSYLGIKESTMGGYLSKWVSGGTMSQALIEFFEIEFDLPGAQEAIEFNDRMHLREMDLMHAIFTAVRDASK